MRGKVLLLSVSLLASLILTEVIVRFALGPPASFLFTGSFRDRQTDWDIVYGVNYDLRRVSCTSWNGKSPRVAVIGDSFVFGQGVPDCKDFSALLNKNQKELYYVNLGIIGIGANEYLQIARDLVDHDYQEVLLLFYGNDWFVAQPTLVQSFISQSSLFTMVRQIWRQRITSNALETAAKSTEPWNNIKAVIQQHPNYALNMVEPNGSMQKNFGILFARIVSQLETTVGNGHIHVALVPSAHTVSHSVRSFITTSGGQVAGFGVEGGSYRHLKALCKQHNIPFIETWPMFLDNGDKFYHPHDFHWNANGHHRMADLIQRELAVTSVHGIEK